MSLFFVNCERTVLFSVKRDLDPPPPPPFTTLFSIVTKILITQRLTRGKSLLRLFDLLGGVHCKLENYGFHKQIKL